MNPSQFGLIGLAVMGQNLALNIADHGFRISVYNRSSSRTEQFREHPDFNPDQIQAAFTLEELVDSLERPRRVMLMIRAGEAVDKAIESLVPLLESGDIIIDGGNSRFTDSQRRFQALTEKGIRFVGSGVSGGEEGARNGPSIMPGGDAEAWPAIREIFQSIAARVDDQPCCHWVGDGGSGHYVKMVHNGIEYGDMQLIAEAYHLMRKGLGMPAEAIRDAFLGWNKGVLDSYLIEITANILDHRDEDGEPLVDKILDAAGQKGTGKWTGISALDLGVPLTLIGEAVFARCLSSRHAERSEASRFYPKPARRFDGNTESAVTALEHALYASKIISYAQGYMLMHEAAREYGWRLNYGDIALMWRGGCIIRSRFLDNIKSAYERNPKLESLLLDEFFRDALVNAETGWRQTLELGIGLGIPLPGMSSAMAFFDGYRSGYLPANMIQAQRDYFGAHTYERVDKPRGEFFHTDWTGEGGPASSSTYSI